MIQAFGRLRADFLLRQSSFSTGGVWLLARRGRKEEVG